MLTRNGSRRINGTTAVSLPTSVPFHLRGLAPAIGIMTVGHSTWTYPCGSSGSPPATRPFHPSCIMNRPETPNSKSEYHTPSFRLAFALVVLWLFASAGTEKATAQTNYQPIWGSAGQSRGATAGLGGFGRPGRPPAGSTAKRKIPGVRGQSPRVVP